MVRNDIWQSSEVYRLVNLLQKEGQNASEILDHLPFAVAVLNPQGHVSEANRRYSAILGVEAFVRDPHLQRLLGEVVESKSARENVRLGRYSATMLPFRSDSALVVIDPREGTPGEGLVDMLEAMDTPAYLMTDDGVIHGANAAIARLTGSSREDMAGAHVSEVHGPGALDTVRSAGVRRSALQTRGGELLPVTLKISALNCAGSTFSLVTVVASSRAMEPAEVDSLGALEAVTGRMAHYMNNWLMVVLSATESLTKNFGTIEALRTDLDFISESTERAAGVARDLLAFSCSRPGPTRLLNVDDALRGVEPLLRTITGPRNLVVQTAAEEAYIRLAPVDFETLLAKLLQNATDATGSEGEITIETARLSPGYPLQRQVLDEYNLPAVPHVRIRVTDNGRGIPTEYRKSLFQPFFTTKPGALGLGLSAVHGIVRRSQGAVVFASEIGNGATFDVVLPEVTK